ncbi:HAD family hydrolase [Chamaesiphon sp.]|uniref:HAD family hydrolase n=1 Tax=Chamaesiphon sp. TaxID=2814140 RepID=UPI003593F11A
MLCSQFQALEIDGLGIHDYFDIMLISEVEQVRKPQPEIFQRALDRLGVAATDSVFVGDNPTADILGANSIEMWTMWKRNSHWLEPKEADVVIDELSEIPSILSQFNL